MTFKRMMLPPPVIQATGAAPAKGTTRYPFDDLAIGESFVVPNKKLFDRLDPTDQASATSINAVRIATSRANVALKPKKFSVGVCSADDRFVQVQRDE